MDNRKLKRRTFSVVAILSGLFWLGASGMGASKALADTDYKMTLPKGTFQVNIAGEVNLNEDAIAKPFAIAPDIWFGITDSFTVGLVHSSFGSTGTWGDISRSLCLAGEENGCSDIYNNAGLELRFNIIDGPFAVAFQAGGYANNIMSNNDVVPLVFAAKAGFSALMSAGVLKILFAPNVFIGINERDAGNKEFANIPLSFLIGSDSFSFGLQGSVSLPFENAADSYIVGASAGFQAGLGDSVAAYLVFSLPGIYASELIRQDRDFYENRTITAGVTFSL